MKKIFLILILIFFLFSCGNTNDDSNDNNQNGNNNSLQEELFEKATKYGAPWQTLKELQETKDENIH